MHEYLHNSSATKGQHNSIKVLISSYGPAFTFQGALLLQIYQDVHYSVWKQTPSFISIITWCDFNLLFLLVSFNLFYCWKFYCWNSDTVFVICQVRHQFSWVHNCCVKHKLLSFNVSQKIVSSTCRWCFLYRENRNLDSHWANVSFLYSKFVL